MKCRTCFVRQSWSTDTAASFTTTRPVVRRLTPPRHGVQVIEELRRRVPPEPTGRQSDSPADYSGRSQSLPRGAGQQHPALSVAEQRRPQPEPEPEPVRSSARHRERATTPRTTPTFDVIR